MDRRNAVKNMALLMGGAISATTMGALLDSCNSPAKKKGGNVFNAAQQATVTEIADIIIPATDTPGAKAAGVGPFITMMINECYPENIQTIFTDGLVNVDDRSKNSFSKTFVELSVPQRNQVLKDIAADTLKLMADEKNKQEEEKKNKTAAAGSPVKKDVDPHFFQLIRELTMLGYFTSEIGASKALVYLPVPGRFDGCVDLKPGQKAWAM